MNQIYETAVLVFLVTIFMVGFAGTIVVMIIAVEDDIRSNTGKDLYVVEIEDTQRHMRFKKKIKAGNYDEVMEKIDMLNYYDIMVIDIKRYRVIST